MVEEGKKEVKESEKSGRFSKAYPLLKLDEAIKVAKVVKDCGGHATKENIGTGLNRKGGWLATSIVSAKRYGLIKGHGELKLTELAERLFNPISETEEREAKRDAFFHVNLFKTVYDRFKEGFPKDELFKNILIRSYDIQKEKDAIKIVNVIKDAAKLFGEDIPTKEKFEGMVLAPKAPKIISKIDSKLFKLIQLVGYLEGLSEYQDKNKIDSNSLKKVIEEMNGLSSGYNSFNTAIGMTNEELKAGSIKTGVCLGRIKFFISALKKDLGIQEEKEQEAGES